MNRPRPRLRPATIGGFAAVVDRAAVKVAQERRWISKLDVRRVIDTFVEELFAELRREGRAAWPGRGVFYVRRTKARDIANPVTGKRMRLPPSLSLGFRAAKAEKERLADAAK